MKFSKLGAVATAAIFHYAVAKELRPTDEFLELYQSGAKHREIMDIKHVCFFIPHAPGFSNLACCVPADIL